MFIKNADVLVGLDWASKSDDYRLIIRVITFEATYKSTVSLLQGSTL